MLAVLLWLQYGYITSSRTAAIAAQLLVMSPSHPLPADVAFSQNMFTLLVLENFAQPSSEPQSGGTGYHRLPLTPRARCAGH